MNSRFLRAVPLAAVLACASAAVQAGAVGDSASVYSAISIVDDGGFSWSINLSPLVTVDRATGAVSLNTAPTLPVVAQGSDAGEWTVASVDGKDALVWHSWTRMDGTVGADTAGGTNLWRSVLTVQKIGGNLDPEMSYGLTFKNNTNITQTYTYTQGETMDTPMAGPFAVQAELVGGLTNASPATTTLNFQPTGAAVQTLWLGNGGVATVNAGVDLGGGVTLPVNTISGGYGSFNSAANGAGGYDYWEFRTSFTLSGGKDVATLSGYAEIHAVPEGSGLAMALTGLLGLAGVQRKRRK